MMTPPTQPLGNGPVAAEATPHRPWTAEAQNFAEAYRRWLTTRQLRHGRESRRRLAADRPDLFGRSPDLALHGYERWLDRERLHDSIETFARYVEPRLRHRSGALGPAAILARNGQ